MTCNPFTSSAAKFSSEVLRPESISVRAFSDALEFANNAANRFDRNLLNKVVRDFNRILQQTDLKEFSILNEKRKQAPINSTEFAEFLESKAIPLERAEKILDSRVEGSIVEEGLIDTVSVIRYPNNPPGIFQKLTASGGSGSDASFDIIVNSGGNSLVIPANFGQNYSVGDRLVIDNLNIEVEVTSTSNLTSPSTLSSIFSEGAISGDVNGSQFTNTTQDNFINQTEFLGFISDFNFFLDDSFGSSITSGQCGSLNLSILAALFGLIGSLENFQNTSQDLSSDVWDANSEYSTSLPLTLDSLKNSFMKIINGILEQALSTIEGFKAAITRAGNSIQTLMKELGNLELFFSNSNVQKIENIVSSIMQKMNDQFEDPIALIGWILTRLCQLSDFISNFLNDPLEKFRSLFTNAQNTRNLLAGESNIRIRNATIFGAVRFDQNLLRQQAREAMDRSGAATAASGARAATSGSTPSIPARPASGSGNPAIYAPSMSLITDEELAQVMQNVTERGWPGYFTFGPSVLNNNYGPRWGERIEGAGWRMIRDHVPMTFYRLKQVIEEAGGGPYILNSAYRSEEYNINRTNAGSGSRSRHIIGTAVDISGAQARVGFGEVARAYGFTEILRYPTFMHIALPRDFGLGNTPRTPDQAAIAAAARATNLPALNLSESSSFSLDDVVSIAPGNFGNISGPAGQ
jgi:hypothetical protein